MSLKSRVDQIEKNIEEQKGITLDDLLNDLPWPEKQKEIFIKRLPHEGKLELVEMLACFDVDYRREVIALLKKALTNRL